jgi:hypothetical protein
MHAESTGLVQCAHEAIYHAGLAHDMGFTQTLPIDIFCDNAEAVELANVGKITQANKHFELRCHELQYLTDKNRPGGALLRITWITTKENLADIGTKAMADVDQYELLRECTMTPKPGTLAYSEYVARMRRAVSRAEEREH